MSTVALDVLELEKLQSQGGRAFWGTDIQTLHPKPFPHPSGNDVTPVYPL